MSFLANCNRNAKVCSSLTPVPKTQLSPNMYATVLLDGSHSPVQRVPSFLIVTFVGRRSLPRDRRENMSCYLPGNSLYPSSGSGPDRGLGSVVIRYSDRRSKRPGILRREKYVGSDFVKFSLFAKRIRNIRAQEANISKKKSVPTSAIAAKSVFFFFDGSNDIFTTFVLQRSREQHCGRTRAAGSGLLT